MSSTSDTLKPLIGIAAGRSLSRDEAETVFEARCALRIRRARGCRAKSLRCATDSDAADMYFFRWQKLAVTASASARARWAYQLAKINRYAFLPYFLQISETFF